MGTFLLLGISRDASWPATKAVSGGLILGRKRRCAMRPREICASNFFGRPGHGAGRDESGESSCCDSQPREYLGTRLLRLRDSPQQPAPVGYQGSEEERRKEQGAPLGCTAKMPSSLPNSFEPSFFEAFFLSLRSFALFGFNPPWWL